MGIAGIVRCVDIAVDVGACVNEHMYYGVDVATHILVFVLCV